LDEDAESSPLIDRFVDHSGDISLCETSIWLAAAVPPVWVMRSTFVAAAVSSMSAMKTFVPSDASFLAVAPPIPIAPTVMIATCPSNLLMFVASLDFGIPVRD